MADYASNAQTALNLIKAAGILVTMTRKAIGAPYDPVVGQVVAPLVADTVWEPRAVVLPATIARFRGIDNKLTEDGNLVLTKARYLLMAALLDNGSYGIEPLSEDRVAFHSKTWRVVGCSPLRPADVPILYQVAVVLEN